MLIYYTDSVRIISDNVLVDTLILDVMSFDVASNFYIIANDIHHHPIEKSTYPNDDLMA